MLPLPLILPIALLIGASGFRLRGDAVFTELTGLGATSARLVCWALPMGGLAWVAGYDAGSAGLLGIGMFLGCLPPWWSSLTLGRNPADGGARGQYLRHAIRGLLWTAPAAAMVALDEIAIPILLGFGAWESVADSGALILLASGLACVPAYELGWRICRLDALGRPGAMEVGEAVFGAAMAAGVVLSA